MVYNLVNLNQVVLLFMVINYFVFLMLSIMCHGAVAVKPDSFSQAKRVVYQLFSNHPKTLLEVLIHPQRFPRFLKQARHDLAP